MHLLTNKAVTTIMAIRTLYHVANTESAMNTPDVQIIWTHKPNMSPRNNQTKFTWISVRLMMRVSLLLLLFSSKSFSNKGLPSSLVELHFSDSNTVALIMISSLNREGSRFFFNYEKLNLCQGAAKQVKLYGVV
mmetsp:Transcript_11489/g.15128  ORF Transcript_11489/g.15128 Transcript_11489/m.15128 type:complete len:134 (+) Transcript_11489:308-709(+)